MPMCGPKTAACCTVLSTWGLIQLGITGVFMYLGSPALVEDIPLAENRQDWSESEWSTKMQIGYQQSALNCWIASLLYLTTLCISAGQMYANSTRKDQFQPTQF